MRAIVYALTVAASSSGCAAVVSDACPDVPAYSAEVQSRAASELEALPEGSAVADLIADYAVMRAELRGGGCGDA